MGHGEEHGPVKMKIPDYRKWKIEGTPLQKVQAKLARKGLKDPWLRNEAWRYMGAFAKPVTLSETLFRGFKWGFAAFVVSLAIEYGFASLNERKEDDEHH